MLAKAKLIVSYILCSQKNALLTVHQANSFVYNQRTLPNLAIGHPHFVFYPPKLTLHCKYLINEV